MDPGILRRHVDGPAMLTECCQGFDGPDELRALTGGGFGRCQALREMWEADCCRAIVDTQRTASSTVGTSRVGACPFK